MTASIDLSALLPPDPAPARGEPAAESFNPIDLDPFVRGNVEQPKPTLLRRSSAHGGGDQGLLYPGAINGIHGDSGVGKSWVVAFLIAECISLDESVLLIDLEDTPASIVSRLRLIGVDPAAIARQVVYVSPDAPFGPEEVRHLLAIVEAREVSAVVVDSLGEAFGIEGINENNDNEVGPWLRSVAHRLAQAGPAVVLVDHMTKAGENKLHASGSKRKRAAIGGASYYVAPMKPFVRGEGGRLKLVCAKDRHGMYRVKEESAHLLMEIDELDGSTRLRLVEPPTTVAGLISSVEEEVTRAVLVWVAAERTPHSKRGVIAGVRGSGMKASNDTISGVIDLMAARGEIKEKPGPRSARMFSAQPGIAVPAMIAPKRS